MIEASMEHLKLSGIMASCRASHISCPGVHGDHEIKNLKYCGRVFTDRKELYRHLRDDHTEEEVKIMWDWLMNN